MSGLVLKLGPKERILINGAVIENGEKRSKLNVVTPNANILRLRDALHPDDVDTPIKCVCYILQLILSGNTDLEKGQAQVLMGLEQLNQVFTDPDSKSTLEIVVARTTQQQFYPALRMLRSLLEHEKLILKAKI